MLHVQYDSTAVAGKWVISVGSRRYQAAVACFALSDTLLLNLDVATLTIFTGAAGDAKLLCAASGV